MPAPSAEPRAGCRRPTAVRPYCCRDERRHRLPHRAQRRRAPARVRAGRGGVRRPGGRRVAHRRRGGRPPPKHNRMHEYLRARTAFFDQAVVDSIDSGVRQVVIGGAGYDGRALRYAKPGVRWFEVDHPSTQADKRRAPRPAGHRHQAYPVHPGRLHHRPDRGTADRGRTGRGPPRPVPARRRRRLPGSARRRARPHRIPRGRGRRRFAGSQLLRRQLHVPDARAVPGAGGRPQRAGPLGVQPRRDPRSPGGVRLGTPRRLRATADPRAPARRRHPDGRRSSMITKTFS